MKRVALLAVLLTVTIGLPSPAGRAASRKDIPKIFKALAKSWKAGKVKQITALLPPKGKVKLALLGVKSGKYREEQATALLEKYFGAIETKEFKIDGKPHGTEATFKHTFRVKADRSKQMRETLITLDREDDRWVIVEIIED